MSKGNNKKNDEMNEIRVRWCIIYLLIGFMLISSLYLSKCLTLQEFLILKLPLILWSASWAAVGIGLCLWNSRINMEKQQTRTTLLIFYLFYSSLLLLQ